MEDSKHDFIENASTNPIKTVLMHLNVFIPRNAEGKTKKQKTEHKHVPLTHFS